MKLRFEHQGRCVMLIDAERLTAEERDLADRIASPRSPLQAGSAECNADFVSAWALGCVDGMYYRRVGKQEGA